jgi:hypothetical protein
MSSLSPSIIVGGRRSRRKGNKSLTSWVAFVKKVAREEKLPYGKAMKRASVRKNKGEKWMTGGVTPGGTLELGDEGYVAPEDEEPIGLENFNVIDKNIRETSKDEAANAAGTTFDEEQWYQQNPENTNKYGGRRRRSKKSRRSKKRRGTKKRRGSRRRHH